MIKHFYSEHQHKDAFSHEIGGELQVIISCYFLQKKLFFEHDETLHCFEDSLKVYPRHKFVGGKFIGRLIII
jgi:hypothetical protein